MRKDYVDSCVFLGFALDQNQNCKDYLFTVGYKNRNIGIISHFVLSEILCTILTKIKHSDDTIKEEDLRESAIKMSIKTIRNLKEEGKLIIKKLSTHIIDETLLKELNAIDNRLTEDDILHIIEAIKNQCDFFVTADKEITENQKLKEYLSHYPNLKTMKIDL